MVLSQPRRKLQAASSFRKPRVTLCSCWPLGRYLDRCTVVQYGCKIHTPGEPHHTGVSIGPRRVPLERTFIFSFLQLRQPLREMPFLVLVGAIVYGWRMTCNVKSSGWLGRDRAELLTGIFQPAQRLLFVLFFFFWVTRTLIS